MDNYFSTQSLKNRFLLYFILFLESEPQKGGYLFLKNRKTGNGLRCYRRTLNSIVDALPKAFQLVNSLPTLGEDMKFMDQEICAYNQTQIVMIIQRFKNYLSILVQMKYDRSGTGKYEYTRSVVQFSPEDNLKELQEFGEEMAAKAEAYNSQMKAMEMASQIDIPN